MRTIEEVPLDVNVYEAAKRRIRWCYENFDEVVINYSGGKDSMALLLLAHEVMPDKKLTVVFFDEEFAYDETLEIIDKTFALPWVNGIRLCLKMTYTITYADGTNEYLTTWDDSNRELFRSPSTDALHAERTYQMTDAEYAVRDLLFPDGGGKRICQLLGIRAQESLSRRTTIYKRVKSGPYCFMRASKVSNITIATPIYDWRVEDVFFYLKNQDLLPISKQYYLALLTRSPLRVGSPLHARPLVFLSRMKEESPAHYERLVRMFPALESTGRYLPDMHRSSDYDAIIAKYGNTVRGVKAYIMAEIDVRDRSFALDALRSFIRDYVEYDRYVKSGNTYESAVRHCFKEIIKGAYGKTIMLPTKVPKHGKDTVTN